MGEENISCRSNRDTNHAWLREEMKGGFREWELKREKKKKPRARFSVNTEIALSSFYSQFSCNETTRCRTNPDYYYPFAIQTSPPRFQSSAEVIHCPFLIQTLLKQRGANSIAGSRKLNIKL